MKTRLSRREFLASLGAAGIVAGLSSSCLANQQPIAQNKIYMTIDDGPKDYMEEMLDLFAETGDRATFFVLGENCENDYGYSLLVRALNEGHLIGNHSYYHPNFKEISEEEAQAQVQATHEILEQAYKDAGRYNPKLFRFPFGAEAHQGVIANNGYKVVRWNVDTKDYEIG
ncbi:hypothetical protein COU56_03955, partial [Candidatus Pacearchaeota archaeon CG10_big_fil_rev_8_21_14_0_10_31_9]